MGSGSGRGVSAEADADGNLCQQLWGYGHQLTGMLFGSSLFSLFSLVNIVKTKCRTFGWRGFEASTETRDVFLEY